MDNPELVLQSLEHFPKIMDEGDYSIPMELEDYIHYVAKTGDPVFQWTLVKPLFREKIIKVVTDFFESTPGEIPDYPNVNKFNYDSMKDTLLERIDWFKGAPFTIQRISELLVNPTKEYNRVDKYMRALEKNIYVVSTREPGMPQPAEENNTSLEESYILNGNDFELKSESSELLGNKGDDDAAALLLLKKCSNSESDEVNFNIEVDVTNTSPAEDASAENIVDSAEINVHEETAEPNKSSEASLNINDGKSGQTRKHEEEDGAVEENESKRFKMDEDYNENESKEENEVLTEEVSSQDVDSNVEPSQGNESINVSQEQGVDSKSDNEMELEETVDNKIESFEIAEKDLNNSSLNISEGDSMVISSQETSEENIEKSIEDNLDPVVSESSDMDLSNIEPDELPPALLEQPEPDNVDRTSGNDVIDQPLLTEKQEDVSTSSTITANDKASVDKEVSSEADQSVQDPSMEADSESTSKQNSNDVQSDLSTVSETPTPNEETKSTKEVQSSEQSSSDNSTSSDDMNIVAVASDAVSVESTPEVEQAMLQEDEFTEVEETGSNVDPLSTEAVEDPELMVKVGSTDDKDNTTSATEEVAAGPLHDSS